MSLASSFLSFLLVAFSLPLGKPSLGIAFEVFDDLLQVFGEPHSLFLLYSLLSVVLLFLYLVLVLFFLDRNVNVLLNELQVSNITKFFRALDSSQNLFCISYSSFTQV